jgi:hypothetical protein
VDSINPANLALQFIISSLDNFSHSSGKNFLAMVVLAIIASLDFHDKKVLKNKCWQICYFYGFLKFFKKIRKKPRALFSFSAW